MKRSLQIINARFIKKSVLTLVLSGSLLTSQITTAQMSSLMQDINTGLANSSPTVFTSVGFINTIFFVADNGTTGSELWKYDILSGVSSLVKDINPGAAGSGITVMTANMTGNGVLFGANNGTNGTELWKSDGTTAGTNMVLDINPGSASSDPRGFYAFGGSFLFSADDGTNGKELWTTNGNIAGTAMLKDINPGINSSDPTNFAAAGLKILFRANDGTNGSELWSTDLTASNTILLKNINTGTLSSTPHDLVSVGSNVFFSAMDPINGAELWKSDGTLAGTQLVKDINPGSGNSINTNPGTKSFFTDFGNILYFQATDGATGYELWKSDGTLAGTTLVKDIQTGFNSSSPSGLFATNTNLFFTANDGINGQEVWMSDGTTAGTTLLKDVNPGSASGTNTTTTFVRAGSGAVYFAADNGSGGTELWRTIGNTINTTMISDIHPGSTSSFPAGMIVYNNFLYFSANDGVTGIEPWRFDPTAIVTTGLNKQDQNETFQMYPNPCSDFVTVSVSDKNSEVQLISALGQVIYSQKINDVSQKVLTIATKELKSGLYFIKVISEKGENTKKLIAN